MNLNLGILAHVDAGKTTLTERLLFAAGIIDAPGSVDRGTTQTDSLPLERRRGITIKSAVVSFPVNNLRINLIDTPGHPDFIAEVERVLGVLDGAILVVSAVEAVQPQTRLLMRALERLGKATLLFVNKIDRPGASEERVLDAISGRLGLTVAALNSTRRLGTRAAEAIAGDWHDREFLARVTSSLAEHDERVYTSYVEPGGRIPGPRLREILAAQTARGLVHPVFFGSALTGAGVEQLMQALPELLPTAPDDVRGPLSGTVFKIERGDRGGKVAYVRLFSGTVHTRQRVPFGDGRQGRINAIGVFETGGAAPRSSGSAGQIIKVWGLREVRIGDSVGDLVPPTSDRQFAPPTLEALVVPTEPADGARLRLALSQLAEHDPLIGFRQEMGSPYVSVSLFGEVQQEVIAATLAEDYGIPVTFRPATTIYIERPRSSGRALELLQSDGNPFSATIGIRVEPGPPASAIDFRLAIDPRTAPTHIYKNIDAFAHSMTEYVHHTLEEGLFGWPVIDCIVTMTDCGYYASDGPTKPTRPTTRTVAADFRKLTPIVLMRALARARTVVCEPVVALSVEAPSERLSAVITALARLGGAPEPKGARGDLSVVEAVLPAAKVQAFQRRIAPLTGGDGAAEAAFSGYRPVADPPPKRLRTTVDPRDLDRYLPALR
ncbi:MAG TPA: translation factor GTPase family protein [Acidimicrobiales bacterium]|nr:translation factor GTPase family protein [Acidimicrobiales bacterium]